MPESLGEQKGEISPFFHIPCKSKLKEILLKERETLSFLSEEDLQLLSTFFHNEEQEQFLSKAVESLKKRQTIASEMQAQTRRLSNEIAELAGLFSFSEQDESTATQSCVRLTEKVEEKVSFIRTNIISCLSNQMIYVEDERIFFQIEKEILLLEVAYKALGKSPEEWESTQKVLLAYPPSELTSRAAHVLELYRTLESFLSSQLLLAAKAAKSKNAEKYANILYDASRTLSDAAKALKSLAEA